MGAGKGCTYQNPEYFSFHHMSFFDLNMGLRQYRKPCPKSGRKPNWHIHGRIKILGNHLSLVQIMQSWSWRFVTIQYSEIAIYVWLYVYSRDAIADRSPPCNHDFVKLLLRYNRD